MENKKQLLVFDIARKAFETLKRNKVSLIRLSIASMVLSGIFSALTEPLVAYMAIEYVHPALYTIGTLLIGFISLYVFLNLMVSVYNATLGRGTIGFNAVKDYPLKNYVKTLFAFILLIIAMVALSFAVFGAGALILGLVVSSLPPIAIFSIAAIGVIAGLVFVSYVFLKYVFITYETAFMGTPIGEAFSNSNKITDGAKGKLVLGHLLSGLIGLGIIIPFFLIFGGIGYVGYLSMVGVSDDLLMTVGSVYGSAVFVLYLLIYTAITVWIASGASHAYLTLRQQTFKVKVSEDKE